MNERDADKCWCCGHVAEQRGVDDPWEGRLDGYCYACALARCDAYPGECPNTPPAPLTPEEEAA